MEQFLGQIQPFAFGIVPKGWAACNGQTLAISANQALFSLLSNKFGGDGTTNFALPNLQGAAAMSFGPDGLGNNYTLGQAGGEASHQLSIPEMPNHSHQLSAAPTSGTTSSPSGNLLSQALDQNGNALNMYGTGSVNGSLAAATVGNNGAGQGHENRMPFQTVNYCIATVGIYPTRA